MNVYWKTIVTFVVTAAAIITGRAMGKWSAQEIINSSYPLTGVEQSAPSRIVPPVSQAVARPTYTTGSYNYHRPSHGSTSQARAAAQRKYDRGTMR